jgi:hypothetical protein
VGGDAGLCGDGGVTVEHRGEQHDRLVGAGGCPAQGLAVQGQAPQVRLGHLGRKPGGQPVGKHPVGQVGVDGLDRAADGRLAGRDAGPGDRILAGLQSHQEIFGQVSGHVGDFAEVLGPAQGGHDHGGQDAGQPMADASWAAGIRYSGQRGEQIRDKGGRASECNVRHW